MAAKAILVLCASALLVQSALAQCIGRAGMMNVPYDIGYGGAVAPIGYGYGCGDIAASYGGGLAITSTSPIAPTGIVVNSENAIDGTVAVVGNMPFLGSVSMEGVFPTAGAGTVSYGCGDGYIGIVSELPGYGVAAPVGIAPAQMGYVDYGLPYGVAAIGGCGCGCGYGPMY